MVRNSGLVDVARNSGSVDVGTNMLQGRLEVGYNGPSNIPPGIRERRVHNQTGMLALQLKRVSIRRSISVPGRTVGTAQETRGEPLFPGNGQRLGATVNPESDGRVLLDAPTNGQVASGLLTLQCSYIT